MTAKKSISPVKVFAAVEHEIVSALASESKALGLRVTPVDSVKAALESARGRRDSIVMADAKQALPLLGTLSHDGLSLVLVGAPYEDALKHPAVRDVISPGAPLALYIKKLSALAEQVRLAASVNKLKSRGEKMAEQFQQMKAIFDKQRQQWGTKDLLMEHLAVVSREINCLDLGRIMEICVTQVPMLVGAQYASIFLVDENTSRLALKGHNYPEEKKWDVAIEQPDKTLMGRALRDEKLLFIEDAAVFDAEGPEQVLRTFADKHTKRSCIGRVVGILNLADREDGDGLFSKDDVDAVGQLAEICGSAIANCLLHAESERAARTDGLTGLLNHRTLIEVLRKEVSRSERYETPLSFVMLDIDHFKKFNDTHGHQAGDFVLKKVAKVLTQCTRDTDVTARYGGEEFALILTETPLDGAVIAAERIRKVVEISAAEFNGAKLHVTVSIGVAQYEKGLDMASFIKTSDDALYRAKKAGRNHVEKAT